MKSASTVNLTVVVFFPSVTSNVYVPSVIPFGSTVKLYPFG